MKTMQKIAMVVVLSSLAGCAGFEMPDLRNGTGLGRAEAPVVVEPTVEVAAIPPAEDVTTTPLGDVVDTSVVNRGPCLIGAGDGIGGTGCPQVD